MRAIYLVPSRGRPLNARRLAAHWSTVTTGDTRLQFCLDDDDPELGRYEDQLLDRALDGDRFGFTVGPRLRLGPTLNHHAITAIVNYDAVGFMGDDHLPRTPGWDVELTRSLEPRPLGVVYGNDLVHGPGIPTAALLSSRLIAAVGFMCPPGLVHMYLDNFWKDLGTATGQLWYRHDVVIEHLHPIAGKADWDDGYAEVNALMGPDREAYARFVASPAWTEMLARVEAARREVTP